MALQVLVSTTTIPAIRVARYRLEYTNHHVQHPPSQEKGDPASHQVLSGSKSMSRRSLERVLGKLQHASIVNPVGKTALKFLNHHMVRYANKGMRDKIQPIPQSLRSALRRWLLTPVLSIECCGSLHQQLWTFTRTPPSRGGAPTPQTEGRYQAFGHQCSRRSISHLGTGDSLLGDQTSKPSKGHSRPLPFRQHHGGSVPETAGPCQVSSTERLGVVDRSFPGETGSVPLHISCGRSPQRHSRRPVSQEGSGDGMDVGRSVLSMDLQPGCSSGSRSIRYPGELEASEICVSSSRPPSSGDGRLCTGLEQVGKDLSFSSLDADFEGFEPAANIQRTSGSGGSTLASPNLVSTPPVPSQGLDPLPNPCLTQKVGSETFSLGSIWHSTFTDGFSEKEFSVGTVETWQGTHRTSSWRQYESVWAAFPTSSGRGKWLLCLERLSHPLCGISPTTRIDPQVYSILLVGLTRPLRAWGINTSDEICTDLIRAFANLLPTEPYRPFSWSLDKVLGLLSEVEYSSAGNLEWTLSKALFH